MDLFQMAEANSQHLADKFDARAASIPSPAADLLQEFAAEVAAQGRISINMRPFIAADFVQSGRYDNIHQSVAEAADFSKRSEEELLRERLDTYFTRRIGFDTAFEGGKRFHYGSLNIGGAGTRRYGTICVVLNAAFSASGGLVSYLKTDSLNGYTDANGTVDLARLSCDVATESHRQCLAALKHAGEIESRRGDWAQMLCNETEYVEAVFIADIRVSSVSEVRLAKSDWQTLWNLCFESHGEPLPEGSRALAQDFLVLQRAQRDNLIRLCEVSDV